MNILVTGAAGYIGSNLLVRLARAPKVNNIVGIDNFYSTPRQLFANTQKLLGARKNVSFHQMDFYDLENVVPLLEQVDVLVHLAEDKESGLYSETPTITNEKVLQWQKNVEGYRRLLEASVMCGVKRIVLGSWAGVYVKSENIKMTENEPLAPVSQYYHQKISQEYYNRLFAGEYMLDTATARMSNVYGIGPNPHRWCVAKEPGVIPIMIEKALRDKEIVVHNEGLQKRNFLYISDAVDALEKIIFFDGKFKGKTLNICSDEEIAIKDIAEWISGVCKAKINYRNVKWQRNIVEHDVSNAQAKKLIGFSPTGDVKGKIIEVIKQMRKALKKK